MKGPVGWIVGGTIGGAIGAAIWAAIAAFTGYEIGWIAWGVGFLVGLGVRICSPESYGAAPGGTAAVISLLALAAGKMISLSIVAKNELGVDLPFSALMELLPETLGPMDFLFGGLAVFTAFKVGGAMGDE